MTANQFSGSTSRDPLTIPGKHAPESPDYSSYPAMVSGSAMGGGVQDRFTLREVKESTSGRPGADIGPAGDINIVTVHRCV